MTSQASPLYEVTLRGFSPRELVGRAEQQCAARFGRGGYSVEESRCVPCVCSIGGRVHLYEARVRARPLTPAITI